MSPQLALKILKTVLLCLFPFLPPSLPSFFLFLRGLFGKPSPWYWWLTLSNSMQDTFLELLLCVDHYGGEKGDKYTTVPSQDIVVLRQNEMAIVQRGNVHPRDWPDAGTASSYSSGERLLPMCLAEQWVGCPFIQLANMLSAPIRGGWTKNTTGFQLSTLEIPSVLGEIPVPFKYLLFPHPFSYQTFIECLLFSLQCDR